MAQGPGKYDDECTAARQATAAAACLLIVLGGRQGNGFSCQATSPLVLAELPRLLRHVADDIERDARESGS